MRANQQRELSEKNKKNGNADHDHEGQQRECIFYSLAFRLKSLHYWRGLQSGVDIDNQLRGIGRGEGELTFC
jgi:hypothetical protein